MYKETLSNFEMEQRLSGLRPLLELTGKIGYAAARNKRRLEDQLVEYMRMKDSLIRQYSDGESIKPGDENYQAFMDEFMPLADTRHEVEVYRIPIDDAVGDVTGQQLYDAWWMFEEGEDAQD